MSAPTPRAVVHAIATLTAAGKSAREIGQQLGVSSRTVTRWRTKAVPEAAPEPSATTWADRAMCRFDDPEVFFNERYLGAARAACRTCPVRQQCLALALAAEGTLSKHNRYGVFGGLTPEERAARTLGAAS